MDVREFVGGEVTVRTVGGSVCVRGRLNVSLEEPTVRHRADAGDDSDADSATSGASSAAKTLHRRFALPADADCQKVQSILSKDAILTVTIPKRVSDVAV